ncbi:IclR family transcriptional regulator [Larkinella sp. VNQ87]|uniref:IclR family transcriptional regulator n=1 Tax=Larkinella sp. VNQ87 TaxID=3400921 RepID=UPI003C0417DE
MIQVINRAFDLLELISNDPERPKSLGDLADALQLNHGTCANILKTLVARGYVEQVGTKKGYILGAQSYSLTGNDAYRKDLLEAAREEMDALTRAVNENCLLAVLKDNQRIAIYRTFAEQDLQVRTTDIKPVYDAASGRLLLAMLPGEKIQRFIAKYGLPTHDSWPEIKSETELMEALALIRQEELALQTIANRHVMGLAVPVYKNGLVVASLSIYLPEYRYMAMDKRHLLDLLRKTARSITKRLI